METITAPNSLIDLMNLTHDAISLNAVYLGISVSAILVLAGILFGVFYFFNLKPLQDKITKQEDKIDALKKETEQVLKSVEQKIQESLKLFEENYEKYINSILVKNDEKNILENKNQIALVEKNIIEKIESVSETKDIKLKEIILSDTINKINVADKSLRETISPLKTSINSIGYSIKTIDRKIKSLELEEFARKNQMGAIYRAVELLKEDIDQKNNYGIPESIQKVEKQIKGILLSASDITQIEEQLVRLDSEPKYKKLVEDLRKAILKKEE